MKLKPPEIEICILCTLHFTHFSFRLMIQHLTTIHKTASSLNEYQFHTLMTLGYQYSALHVIISSFFAPTKI